MHRKQKPRHGYEEKYVQKAKTLHVECISYREKVRGHMIGLTPKQVVKFYERIKKCTCGGDPMVRQTVCMGDVDIIIMCKKCGRKVNQCGYDRKRYFDPRCEELALRKWNAEIIKQEKEKV